MRSSRIILQSLATLVTLVSGSACSKSDTLSHGGATSEKFIGQWKLREPFPVEYQSMEFVRLREDGLAVIEFSGPQYESEQFAYKKSKETEILFRKYGVLFEYDPNLDKLRITPESGRGESQYYLRLSLDNSESIKKARIVRLVSRNLRQIVAASEQYFLENGAFKTTFSKIHGENSYIKKMEIIDGEDYSGLILKMPPPPWNLSITTKSGITVSYSEK